MRRLASALAAAARERPEAVRVVDPDGTAWTNAALQSASEAVRDRVEAACAAGSVVTVAVPSGGGFWSACVGVAAAGCDALPVSVAAPAGLRERIRRELSPSLEIEGPSTRGHAIASGHRRTGGVVLLSSGTTGRSRFIRRTPEAVDAIAAGLVEAGLVGAGDVVGSFLPMYHAYGFEHAFAGPLLAGAEVRQGRNFGIEEARGMLAGGVTVFPSVPPALAALADGPWPYGPLRLVITAGTTLRAAVRERVGGRAGVPLVDLFGASELGTIWLDRGLGGIPVPGVEIRLVDPARPDGLFDVDPDAEGEIAVRSRTRLDRVLGEAAVETLTDDGWFRTGDLGARRGPGRWAVTGRSKLVFDVGGLKVNPFDVESAIEQHPQVRAALVEPVEVGGGLRRVSALVERVDGAAALDAAALRTFLADRVAVHELPRSIEFVDRLPRTPSGKIVREADAPTVASRPPTSRRPPGLGDRPARERWTRRLFDGSADGYDASSGSPFLGSGRWYRRRMLCESGLEAGMTLVDVGGGTGACSLLGQEIVGGMGRVITVDPSPGMLAVARSRGVRETREGRAEMIPMPDASADMVSMGYMLRHVEDLGRAFIEARRVLRPWGRIVILEVTAPDEHRRIARGIFRFAMRQVAPAVGLLASGRPATVPMMRYWADTIEDAVRPAEIVAALEATGFTGVRHRAELGVFSCYRGIRPG
jgi:demethylmenaquinone methyltransferase/2-methoxy-6-polyprenyl-1,4-benzoquinol methylase